MSEIDIVMDGVRRVAELRSNRIDWEGRPALLLSLRDITERKEAEELREDVERMTKHDLKTPLNAIVNLPAIMLGDDNLTDEQRLFLGEVVDAGRRMLNLINASLTLYKIEQGDYAIQAEAIDGLRLLRSIVRDTDSLARAHGVALELHANGEPAAREAMLPILCEELLCYTMVANLVTNAIEASTEGDRVVVDIRETEDESRIAISNPAPVDPTIRDIFFDKYVTKGKAQGTGLGTYTARMIAQAHGGGIELRSDAESGTEVVVRLPKGPPPAS
jgi:signal transduction histidine kinase